MKKLLDDVAEFHRVTDSPSFRNLVQPIPMDRRALRIKLITEEIFELVNALFSNDLIDVSDALADSIYVLVGTALEYGIPLDRVWDEVHASNMTKTDPRADKVLKRADGKILKPATFRPPNISAAIYGVNPTGRAPLGWHLCK